MKMNLRQLSISITLLIGLHRQAVAAAAEPAATIDAFNGKPCFTCHQSRLSAPFVHGALTGNRCTPCHKLSNGNHQLNHWLAAVKERSSRLCYECHEDRSRQKSVHPPILNNDCLVCHAPHTASHENLLRTGLKELCFGCHGRSLVTVSETLDATGFRDNSLNLHYLHAGKHKIPCLGCHDAHASDLPHLIHAKWSGSRETVTITFTATTTGGTCTTSCHAAAGYGRK